MQPCHPLAWANMAFPVHTRTAPNSTYAPHCLWHTLRQQAKHCAYAPGDLLPRCYYDFIFLLASPSHPDHVCDGRATLAVKTNSPPKHDPISPHAPVMPDVGCYGHSAAPCPALSCRVSLIILFFSRPCPFHPAPRAARWCILLQTTLSSSSLSSSSSSSPSSPSSLFPPLQGTTWTLYQHASWRTYTRTPFTSAHFVRVHSQVLVLAGPAHCQKTLCRLSPG